MKDDLLTIRIQTFKDSIPSSNLTQYQVSKFFILTFSVLEEILIIVLTSTRRVLMSSKAWNVQST